MAKKGRPGTPAVRRLMEVVLGLAEAGDRGIRSDKLADMVGHQTADATVRDLKKLEQLGWQLESIQDPEGGKKRVYRIRRTDVRLAAQLLPEERAELHRVALLMGLEGVDSGGGGAKPRSRPDPRIPEFRPSPELAKVNRALKGRQKVRFVYSGSPRRVSPVAVIAKPVGFFLVGVEDGSDDSKEFALARMSTVRLDPFNSARVFDAAEHQPKDAIHWPMHDPRTFWVELAEHYHPDAVRLLGEPDSVAGRRLFFTVTNFRAARARIYELLEKVDAVGPDWVRRYLARDLAETVGASRLEQASGN